MPHPNRQPTFAGRLSPWLVGQLSVVVAFGLIYWFTLDTGLQPYELRGGDLITHQYAQVQARPGNAPGYPLYTLGGWLWFHGIRGLVTAPALGTDALPPNPMPILSSYSTVWALLALWLLMAIFAEISRAPDRDRFAPGEPSEWFKAAVAALITAFFGLTYFFWYYATTTEQYSSAVAQTLAILLLYLRWERDPRNLRRLFLLAFLCGLSLAHMLTVAFIVPPLVAAVLLRAPWLLRSVRAIVAAIVAAALPLTAYGYVWLRGAHHPQWWGRGDWETPQAWFWDFVGTAQGREELLWGFEPGRTLFGNGFPEFMWQELSVPLLVLGLLGIYRLPQRLPLVLYGTLAIYLLFCWAYRFGNWFQVIIPAYPLILVGVYSAIEMPARVARRLRTPTASLLGVAILVSLVAAILWRIDASLPAANSRARAQDTALHRAADLLAQVPGSGSLLFAAVDDALALDYLINIWGLRPGLAIISSPQADQALGQGTVVYATWDATPTLLRELATTPVLAGVTPDWVALQLSSAVAPSLTPLHTILPLLSLDTVETQPAPKPFPPTQTLDLATSPDTDLDVKLTWGLPSGVWPADLAISLRPTAGGVQITHPDTGAPIQQDRPRPIHGLWEDQHDGSAMQVIDSYRLPIPAGTVPDGLLLIVYTRTEDGFRNVAELHLPLSAQP